MSELTNTEYQILLIINSNNEPIGSGTISSRISEDNNSLSEATVGRILRNFDRKGYTQKMGFQGRVVTKLGLAELEKFTKKKQKEQQLEKLINISRSEDKTELIDVLVARRAIERETARLAAEHADSSQLDHLEKIVKENEQYLNEGLNGAEEDVLFHQTIAEYSKNSILEAALKMIRSEDRFSPVLEYIRTNVGGIVIRDHKEILKALRTGSPEKAEKAMINHLNNVIRDVNTYWEQVNKDKKIDSSQHKEKKES